MYNDKLLLPRPRVKLVTKETLLDKNSKRDFNTTERKLRVSTEDYSNIV
jgi:hypothetical protein